jgi:tetratricopeptide (TPR) repeat protein
MNRLWQAYWFECGVSRTKLGVFRFFFFALLAIDCFLDLGHAPRYGAGDFNVSNLPWLDWALPMPTRAGFLLCCLLGSYLALRIAFGVFSAGTVKLSAALFGYRYFISQLDSYQHHYLVFLLLLIAGFVPWQSKDTPVRHWAIRLFVVQVALLYFWAAVSKMTGQWTDGSTLQTQITTEPSRVIEFLTGQPSANDLIQAWFGPASPGKPGGFGDVAKLVLSAELLLAAMLLWRRAWPFAPLVGIPFHLTVEFSGFKIGLFSWFMVGFYLLLLPDGWFDWIGRQWQRIADPVRTWITSRLPPLPVVAAIAAGLTAGGAFLMWRIPIEYRFMLVAVITAAGLSALALATYHRRTSLVLAVGIANLGAGSVLLLLHHKTDEVADYWRFLGGSSRRLKNPEQAERAYRKLLELQPDNMRAHLYLGILLSDRGELDDARVHWHIAQDADPPDGDAFDAEAAALADRRDFQPALEVVQACRRELPSFAKCATREALVLAALGRRAEALQAARRAVGLDPRDQAAENVLRWLKASSKNAPLAPPSAGRDNENE